MLCGGAFIVYAQFDDGENYVPGTLSSQFPWGSNYRDPNFREGWREVPDNFIPPVPVKTKLVKLQELNALYAPQIDYLNELIIQAVVLTKSTSSENLYRSLLTDLLLELKVKRGLINNGN